MRENSFDVDRHGVRCPRDASPQTARSKQHAQRDDSSSHWLTRQHTHLHSIDSPTARRSVSRTHSTHPTLPMSLSAASTAAIAGGSSAVAAAPAALSAAHPSHPLIQPGQQVTANVQIQVSVCRPCGNRWRIRRSALPPACGWDHQSTAVASLFLLTNVCSRCSGCLCVVTCAGRSDESDRHVVQRSHLHRRHTAQQTRQLHNRGNGTSRQQQRHTGITATEDATAEWAWCESFIGSHC